MEAFSVTLQHNKHRRNFHEYNNARNGKCNGDGMLQHLLCTAGWGETPAGRRRRWKHSASSVKTGWFRLEGYAGDFCDSQARRSSDGNCLDDPHDLPAYETGTV